MPETGRIGPTPKVQAGGGLLSIVIQPAGRGLRLMDDGGLESRFGMARSEQISPHDHVLLGCDHHYWCFLFGSRPWFLVVANCPVNDDFAHLVGILGSFRR